MSSVFVIDDHPVVAQGVALTIEDDPQLSFIGAAATSEDGVAGVARHQPDLVLLDVRMPDRDVVATVIELRRSSPQSRVLLFTADPSHPHIRDAIAAGAIATLAKNTPPAELRRALHEARSGTVPASASGAAPLLTPRQHDVLIRVATGMTNVEIASELRLRPTTVKAYLQEAMQRLGVRNRAEAIASAYRRGLL